MSRHNRERRRLFKLGLSKRQIGRKLTTKEITKRLRDKFALDWSKTATLGGFQ